MKLRNPLELNTLLRLAAMLIAGIAVADGVGDAVPAQCWVWAMGVAVVLMVGAFWLHGAQRARSQSLLLLAVAFLLGAARLGHTREHLAVALSDTPVCYEAVVTSEPQVKGKTIRMDLLVTQVEGRRLPQPVRVGASLLRDTVASRWRLLHVGSGLRAYSTFEPVHSVGTRRHFDYVRWAQVNGFQAQTFIYYRYWDAVPADLAALSLLQRARLHAVALRQQVLQRFRALGLANQQYGVVAAMALGDRSGLSQTTRDTYAVSGASHVLALSGLHLGIIYGLLTLLLARRKRWLWAGQGLTLCAVWTYVLLVGFPISAVRSATMLTVYAVCLLLQRERLSANALAFAAIAILVVSPLSLWDVGFQLSFLAVLGIMVYQRAFYRLWHPSRRLLRWAWGLTTVSLAAQIATAPLVAYYFERFSCYSLLTNLLVIPAATAILYGTLLLLLTLWWTGAAHLVALLLATVAGWLNSALTAMAGWPGASVEGIRLSWAQVAVLYVALLSLTVIVTYMNRIRRLHVLDAFNGDKDRANRSMPADDLPDTEDVPAADEAP